MAKANPRKNPVINGIAKVLRENFLVPRADIDTSKCRRVATEIAAKFGIPQIIWIVATEIENTGRDEQVFLTREVALENAAHIVLGWLDDNNYSDCDDWESIKQDILAAIEAGDNGEIDHYEVAIERWNDFQNTLMDADAEIFVFELQLNCE